MDTVSKKKRSEIMSRVKSKGSKIETSLMRELNKEKFRYKKHVSKLPGTPDIAFMGEKTVVFVDSCFWHGCRWHGTMPASNKDFWIKKISMNKERDRKTNREYKKMGWKVIRLWEHGLKKESGKAIHNIVAALKK
ncbi:MAG: very short patch repair endonuclease [Patescibacteria group bacterium]